MSIIARSELVKRLHDGSIVISPILSAAQIGAASIDLRLGNVALMARARGSSHVDPALEKKAAMSASGHDAEIGRQHKHERHEIPFGTKFLLHPGSLVLMPTLEWVQLPNDVHASVTARSTWAREGLNIATATFIEPGYQGIITLELANFGGIPIVLYPGLRVAQIAFATVEGSADRKGPPQFKMSFEPKQGRIADKDDFPFIPDAT